MRFTHPRLLYPMCLAEMGERFSFHAMRGILVLYMTKVFHFSNSHAYEVFATFTALLYFTPLFGGYIAERLCSFKNAVVIGGLLLSCGYFLLAFPSFDNFYSGLAITAIGNGFFMPNIASCIGNLYQQNNSLRESGFSIFYVFLNIGAFLPPFITVGIIAKYGWHAAFLVSSCTALLSTLIFFLISNNANKIYLSFTYFRKNFRDCMLILTSILIAGFLCLKLIEHYRTTIFIVLLCSLLIVIYALAKSCKYDPVNRNKLLLCFVLTFYSIIFWMLSEQTALSLTIFTEYNVQRKIYNYTIPTIFFFSLNPFFIILFGPIFSKIWVWLDTKNLNPSIPTKFSLGTILMGLGFAILPLGISWQNSSGQINLFWLIFSYLLQSIGELFLSPIGLSMLTELAPKKMWGFMIGLWYLATAIAYLLAGFTAKWTTISSGSDLPLETMPLFFSVFSKLGWITIAAGFSVLLLVPLFKKAMTFDYILETNTSRN